MGRVVVDVTIMNHRDIILFEEGHLPPEKIRRVTLQGTADTAAYHLVLPASAVHHLGLRTPFRGHRSLWG